MNAKNETSRAPRKDADIRKRNAAEYEPAGPVDIGAAAVGRATLRAQMSADDRSLACEAGIDCPCVVRLRIEDFLLGADRTVVLGLGFCMFRDFAFSLTCPLCFHGATMPAERARMRLDERSPVRQG